MAAEADDMFLVFEDAAKSFDGLAVFEGLSFSLRPGIVYGLVGPNACGKTTLLHSAMGLTHLSKGAIHYRGRKVTDLKPHSIARLGLGIVLQNVGVFQKISVWENVLTGLPARKGWAAHDPTRPAKESLSSSREQAQWALEQVGLKDMANQLAGSLVPGEQKRLAIARTLFSARDFLLDEPVSGVDHRTRESLHQLIREMAQEGRSMLVVEHDIDFVLRTCDEVMFLKAGRIACQGPPPVVQADEGFQEFYQSLRV